MTVALVLGGTGLLLFGAVIASFEQWALGILAAVVGVGMVVAGLVVLERNKDAARARCDAQGGTFADLRNSDICFAPGVVLEVSE